jgi:hypothetical protein
LGVENQIKNRYRQNEIIQMEVLLCEIFARFSQGLGVVAHQHFGRAWDQVF